MLPNLILKETSSDKYPPRTYHNAKSADVTAAFAVDLNTAGEKLTHKAAGDKYIGFLLEENTETIDLARKLYKKLKSSNATSLNVAGNGIYTLSAHGCSQEFINLFVYEVLEKVHQHHPLKKIYTGGQTGVDMAGAIAGLKLGIEVEITFPNGFRQRFDKVDVIQTQENIMEQIEQHLSNLEKSLQGEKRPKP